MEVTKVNESSETVRIFNQISQLNDELHKNTGRSKGKNVKEFCFNFLHLWSSTETEY